MCQAPSVKPNICGISNKLWMCSTVLAIHLLVCHRKEKSEPWGHSQPQQSCCGQIVSPKTTTFPHRIRWNAMQRCPTARKPARQPNSPFRDGSPPTWGQHIKEGFKKYNKTYSWTSILTSSSQAQVLAILVGTVGSWWLSSLYRSLRCSQWTC